MENSKGELGGRLKSDWSLPSEFVASHSIFENGISNIQSCIYEQQETSGSPSARFAEQDVGKNRAQESRFAVAIVIQDASWDHTDLCGLLFVVRLSRYMIL